MRDIPQEVLDVIKKAAFSEWPNDFEMQKYKIDNQIKAYKELMALRQAIRDESGIFDGIVKSAEKEWPNDFEMQLYKIRNQLDAISSLAECEKEYADVPQEVLEQIRVKAMQEWPDDFEMQKYTIGNQVQAWRELQQM